MTRRSIKIRQIKESTMSASSNFVTVYGQKMHYLEAGQGSVVILLHALGFDTSDWSNTIAPLSKHFRVIAFDQVGTGESDKPLINYRPQTWVDFLGGFYQALNLERASLIGHSIGGATAAAFAIAHPEKVDRVVLVDAGYGYAIPNVSDPSQLGHNPGTLHLINPSTREEARQLLKLTAFAQQPTPHEADVDQLFATTARSGYVNQRFIESFIRHEDVLDGNLSRLKHQTLILQGREDDMTPLELSQRFDRDIPNSQLVIFDQCGHSPHSEQPEQFLAVVLPFFGVKG